MPKLIDTIANVATVLFLILVGVPTLIVLIAGFVTVVQHALKWMGIGE